MRSRKYNWRAVFMLAVMLAWVCAAPLTAGAASNDNSLASLGILTEGAQVTPEFGYGVTEYDVTVPAGTEELSLDPVPSDGNAWIVDISGTELVDGAATVEIVVSAENGEQYPYYLHVKEELPAPQVIETEPVQTEPETEPEPETEDPRYVKVDRTALQEAENTINALKDETRIYRDRSKMLMNILYGMIAFCVILLFVVINLILKKKDLKTELQEYMGYGYPQEDGGQEMSGQVPGRVNRAQEYEPEPERMRDDPAAVPKPERMRDDPATVPKPERARKKARRMPEYEQTPPQEYSYRKSSDSKPEDVEVTMIDL